MGKPFEAILVLLYIKTALDIEPYSWAISHVLWDARVTALILSAYLYLSYKKTGSLTWWLSPPGYGYSEHRMLALQILD